MKKNAIVNWAEMKIKIPITGCKRNPTILDKNMATKKHNKKKARKQKYKEHSISFQTFFSYGHFYW